MGVAPTGAIFKGLTFDGESSKDYGIYITGAAVFNAPARDVEMITIPGRNGTFALDRGRFENIEVTYPAGLFGDTEADFAQGISDFRNFLASRQGYVELSDDYNPGEYRLAVYKNGLDVTPEQLKAGEFEIVFECKPQRFLTSGEDEIAVTSGDTVTNPTLFDSHPLLAVTGYGTINIGGGDILLENAPLGEVALNSPLSAGGGGTFVPAGGTKLLKLDVASLNIGDAIGVPNKQNVGVECVFTPELEPGFVAIEDGTYTKYKTLWAGHIPLENIYGTADAGGAAGTTNSFRIYDSSNGTYEVGDIQIRVYVPYDGADTITIQPTLVSHTFNDGVTGVRFWIGWTSLYGQSTQLTTGNPAYIDLDIGEAYKVESGEIVSINKNVQLPALLPTLTPGANTVTFDNTFTSVKITPRWWKV